MNMEKTNKKKKIEEQGREQEQEEGRRGVGGGMAGYETIYP